MRYGTWINNEKMMEWGLNIQQAYLFSWMYELPSWAEKIVVGRDIYYFAAKTKAIEELPALTTKIDTMRRHYKSLKEKGLIKIEVMGGKDYISLTEKAKKWNDGAGKKSRGQEKNPVDRKKIVRTGKKSSIGGKKIPPAQEKNPAYNNTIDNTTIDNIAGNKFPVEKPKKKKAEKRETELYNLIKNTYLEYFLQSTGEEYYFQAKDGAKIKSLIKKFRFSIRNKGGTEDDENVINAFTVFLKRLPEFYRNKDLSTLDSKYNDIISQIKNQKNGTAKRQGHTSIFAPNYDLQAIFNGS